MSSSKSKPLMRSLGEFVGHIYRAVKTDPGAQRTVLTKSQREVKRGNITLRRTTIDEIEVKPASSSSSLTPDPRPPTPSS